MRPFFFGAESRIESRTGCQAEGSDRQQLRRPWGGVAGVCGRRCNRSLEQEICLPVQGVVDERSFRVASLLGQALQPLQSLADRVKFGEDRVLAGSLDGGRSNVPVAGRLRVAIMGGRREELRFQPGQCAIDLRELDVVQRT